MKTWEYNVLGLNNPSVPKLKHIIDYISSNLSGTSGVYCEFGVFKGKSFLTIANRLKEANCSFECYGYDTFSGFPSDLISDSQDDAAMFESLLSQSRITAEHYQDTHVLRRHRAFLSQCSSETIGHHSQLSTSGNFTTDHDYRSDITRLASHLELTNLYLRQADFRAVDFSEMLPPQITFALIDADLYSSYSALLPLVWSRMQPGGVIFLDEYYSLKYPGARIAVDEFCALSSVLPLRLCETGDFERWILAKPQI